MNALITTLVVAEGVSLTLLSIVVWRQAHRETPAPTAARIHLARIQAQQPEVNELVRQMTTRG